MNEAGSPVSSRVRTGIDGLDDILGGGLPPDRLYLIQGDPGTGKTTTALQYLLEGRQRGERGLFITLSETAEELHAVARSHDWNLEGIDLFELSAAQQNRATEQNTLFHPSEVDLNEVTQTLLDEVERIQPHRVVIDSLSEMRLLAQSALRFRRQILALKQYFIGKRCTVLLLDDPISGGMEAQAHTVAHGVLQLEQLAPEYGAERRRLRLLKLRGVRFRGGYHDYTIVRGGLRVFPRLIAAEHRATGRPLARIGSGIGELDALLGGGIEGGTSLLIMGPAGSGKTTIATQYVHSASERGDASAVFLFDENDHTLFVRAVGMGMDLQPALDAGRITIRQIDPSEMPVGEFVQLVRQAVEQNHARIVVIDSLNGYLNAMPEERFLAVHMHELLTYLRQQGVLTILILAQHGLMDRMESPVDVSYLADSVLLLRFFEAGGRIHQALSVVKKRTGSHERTLREFKLSDTGIRVGPPLEGFHGVLTGVPNYTGRTGPLLKD